MSVCRLPVKQTVRYHTRAPDLGVERGPHVAETKKATGDHINELKELVVAYAKQETVEPLKGLGRYVANGLAGAVCIAIGLVLLTFSLLRGLQVIGAEEQPAGPATGGVFTGDLSFVPYVIVAVLGLAVAGLAVRAIMASDRPERERLSSTNPKA